MFVVGAVVGIVVTKVQRAAVSGAPSARERLSAHIRRPQRHRTPPCTVLERQLEDVEIDKLPGAVNRALGFDVFGRRCVAWYGSAARRCGLRVRLRRLFEVMVGAHTTSTT